MPTTPEAEAIARHARAVERLRIVDELLGGLLTRDDLDGAVAVELGRIHALIEKAMPDLE